MTRTEVVGVETIAPEHDRTDMAVTANNVTKRFGDVLAVEGATFSVPNGGRLGLLGPSGSGKSTLLTMIAGLHEQDSGDLSVEGGLGMEDRLQACALMPQRDLLFPWRTAIQNACLALENRGVSKREARKIALPHFERVGLADFADVPSDQLSGGMRQRVAFLRTLLAEKPLLLLDEPFGALDSIVRAQMQEWLLAVLRDTSRTMVLVTHDVEEALYLCDRVVVLSSRPGRVVLTLGVDPHPEMSRREVIAQPAFVEAKDRILEALES
jgi:NitT/TauT family transport system ATP-binding protein